MKLNELLNEFEIIANSPKTQFKKYLKEDKKVILCAPVYTPEEIVDSFGMIPFGTWGADSEITQAKKYFPAFICSIMQTILDKGIENEYEGASGLLVPSLCDSLKCLGQNWKYAVKDIPFIPMSYPQNRKAKFGVDFTYENYKTLIKTLEEISGKQFNEESLVNSINIYNKHNELMRELSKKLINNTNVSTKQRSAIFKSAFFMSKAEHNDLLEKLLIELDNESIVTDKVKIVTSGILVDSKNLLEIFDEFNIQIVNDDVAAESRQYRVDTIIEKDPLYDLATKFGNYDNCSVLYDKDKKRADLIVNMVKDTNADGVLVVLTKFCDPEEFDYVIIKKACEANNIPLMLVEVDRQMVNFEQAKTLIQTFVENL